MRSHSDAVDRSDFVPDSTGRCERELVACNTPLVIPSSAWRVLVVESDDREGGELQRALCRHGYRVDVSDTGLEALRTFENVDVVLLELDLDDVDGLEVCRGIRMASDVPIIVVTVRDSELDCVLTLQAGADDYLVKPCRFRELVARMDAVMRRTNPHVRDEHMIVHGPLRIDTQKREVHLVKRKIPMSRKEFDLLYLLASQPDSVVPREEIMRRVWGNSWSRRTVDTHVSSIRNKLGGNSWILTVRGVGFRIGHA